MSLCVLKNNQNNDDDEDRYLDEDRMCFFNSLKAVGTSFALVRKSNGDPTLLMYEGLSDDAHNDSDQRLTRSFTRKILLDPKKPAPRRRYKKPLPKKHNKNAAQRSHRFVEPQKVVACKLEAMDDGGSSDRAYEIWLRNFTQSGYADAQTSSDPDFQMLDKDPECTQWRYNPLALSNLLDHSMEDDDLQYIGERSKPENPQFRKDVEDILGRPYDDEEYQTLWLQVNSRKPMQGYRELRGHLKAYPKDAMGKSYLDDYFDLRRKLDALETDLPRKLNVLRGFFYYLKNIASDGIFKPWLDESCLAIVPRTE